MVNAEGAENKLKAKVFRHWKDIQRQCRNLDTGNTGTISVSEFSGKTSYIAAIPLGRIYRGSVAI